MNNKNWVEKLQNTLFNKAYANNFLAFKVMCVFYVILETKKKKRLKLETIKTAHFFHSFTQSKFNYDEKFH